MGVKMKYCTLCKRYLPDEHEFCPWCCGSIQKSHDASIITWLLVFVMLVITFFCAKGCLNDYSDFTVKQLKYGITFDKYCMIKHASSVAGINDKIEFEKIKAESNFKGSSVSYRGALGESQVMPSIAGHYRLCPWKSYDNILCGAFEYRACRKKSQNNYFALMKYNSGKNRIVYPFESHLYANKILTGVM